MEVPLLSQDEFFRHLNLRSVHATSAKYHYRQALKERLRASSQVKSLTVNKSSSQQENNQPTKSPTVSPVKWLTPKTRKKMFGRPKIRTEKRILDFDNNIKVVKGNDNQKLLQSLLSNCHVLRHPGIRAEVQSNVYCGRTKGSQSSFNVKDEFWEPPSSNILERKCYWNKKQDGNSPSSSTASSNPTKTVSKASSKVSLRSKKVVELTPIMKTVKKAHVIHYRVQPIIKLEDKELRTRNEQKMAAALALYHFYKPRSKDGKIISFKEFTKVFISQSNGHFPINLTVPIKKLSNYQLKKCHPQDQPSNHMTSKTQHNYVVTQVIKPIETIKTSYGRVSKPVLAPIKTENVQCDQCEETFNSLANLKVHMKKVHDAANGITENSCTKPNYIIPMEVMNAKRYKCDICYRRFDKRSRMIRHIKNVHSTDIHRVDLSTFVMPKKFQQAWTLFELS